MKRFLLRAALDMPANKNGRAMCGRCAGKGFDPKHSGGQRKCPRCTGAGFTLVGGTKR